MTLFELGAMIASRLALILGAVGFGIAGLMNDGELAIMAFTVGAIFFILWVVVSIRWMLLIRKRRRAIAAQDS